MSKETISIWMCRWVYCIVCVAILICSISVQAEPPRAHGQDVPVSDPNLVIIELVAEDDGLPVPPGEFSFIITSLPEHGLLYDPNDGLEIVTSPYTLQNDTNSVIYEPCPYFDGTDTFSFKANDGGESPDNGDSNIADVNVVMDMSPSSFFGDGTFESMVPFFTDKKKVRSQTLYDVNTLGNSAMTISHLALEIQRPPAIDIQNWTIRMKHTTETSFPASQPQFDNEDLIVVYLGDESIDSRGWYNFPLQTKFNYDGVSNLLIDFTFDNPNDHSTYGKVYSFGTSEYQLISYWTDNDIDILQREAAYNPSDKILFNLRLKTPGDERLVADFNYNCVVGIEDLFTMIDAWMAQSGDENFNGACDMITNNKVDLADFAVLASEWLEYGWLEDPMILSADFDGSGSVGPEDLLTMAGTWLAQDGDANYNGDCDISATVDNKVDLADYAILASEWLAGTE